MPENYFEQYRKCHGSVRAFAKLMNEVYQIFEITEKYSSPNQEQPDAAQAQHDLEYLQTYSNIPLEDIQKTLASLKRVDGNELVNLIRIMFDAELTSLREAAGLE